MWAQTKGISQELCEPDTVFRQNLADCISCVEDYDTSIDDVYELSSLGEILKFCGIPGPTSTAVFTWPNETRETIGYLVPSSGVDVHSTSHTAATSTTEMTEALQAESTTTPPEPTEDKSEKEDDESEESSGECMLLLLSTGFLCS